MNKKYLMVILLSIILIIIYLINCIEPKKDNNTISLITTTNTKVNELIFVDIKGDSKLVTLDGSVFNSKLHYC